MSLTSVYLLFKYYIYVQRLFNNNYLDVYFCQTQLKADIENEKKFDNNATCTYLY